MNWDQIEGQWKDLKGRMRQQWGKLTDDDIEQIGGKKDRLLGKLQERYGYHKDQAETELNRYIDTMNADIDRPPTKH